MSLFGQFALKSWGTHPNVQNPHTHFTALKRLGDAAKPHSVMGLGIQVPCVPFPLFRQACGGWDRQLLFVTGVISEAEETGGWSKVELHVGGRSRTLSQTFGTRAVRGP